MLGVVGMYPFALLVVLISSGLVACQVQFTSQYNGGVLIGNLGMSVNFTWTFTGDLLVAHWGTKRADSVAIKDKLVSLNKDGPLSSVVPPPSYNGRVSGTWNGSTPGQLTFMLTSIQENDDNIFLCEIVPSQAFLDSVIDKVQLIVRDSSNSTVIPPKVVPAKEGSSACFTCNASGIPSPNIIWTRRNGKGVNEIVADSGKYQVTSTSGSSKLTIKNITVEDQSYFLCNASSFDFDLDRAFLGVVSLYESNISCPSTTQSASRGVHTSICCPIHGFPPPEVTWKLPNGTVLETKDTILPITPKTDDDFGKYTCSASGLKETVPDPIVVSIYLGEKGKKTSIEAKDIAQLKAGDKFQWDEVNGTTNYICRICGGDINCTSVLVVEPSLEIPYSSLIFINQKNKPDPVAVVIEVLAVGDNDVLGKGGPFNINIRSVAATPRLSFMVVIVLFISAFSLQ